MNSRRARPGITSIAPGLVCAWSVNEGTESFHRRSSIFAYFLAFFFFLFIFVKQTSSQTTCSQVYNVLVIYWQNVTDFSVSSCLPCLAAGIEIYHLQDECLQPLSQPRTCLLIFVMVRSGIGLDGQSLEYSKQNATLLSVL